MRQHFFFPSVCPGSPRTSILLQKGNMNVNTNISKVSSTIPHWPNKQSCTFYSRIFGINAEHTTNSSLGYLIPASTTFSCLSTTFLCVSMTFWCRSTVCPRFVHGLVRRKKNSVLFLSLKPFTCPGAKNRSAEEKIYFNPWKPRVDPNGVLNWWECGQWIVIQQPRNSSNIVVPWLPMFGSSASLGPQIQQFTF